MAPKKCAPYGSPPGNQLAVVHWLPPQTSPPWRPRNEPAPPPPPPLPPRPFRSPPPRPSSRCAA
eukprot:scaffold47278_cov63-Phaeocystis_antarctica.AAC.3